MLSGLEAKAAQPGAYLAMCLVVRDQNNDLREWIEYHYNLGVSKFYIFDDNSTAPADQDILDLVEAGVGLALTSVHCGMTSSTTLAPSRSRMP